MTDIWIAAGAGIIVVIAVTLALSAMGRAEHRRATRWHRAYFHRGGLVRDLMARWGSIGARRLTDQRPSRLHDVGKQPADDSDTAIPEQSDSGR